MRFLERLHPMFRQKVCDVHHYTFWRDGLHEMSRKACMALRLAGAPVTPSNIARFIDSAPREQWALSDETWLRNSYCRAVLKVALGKNPGNREIDKLNEYFFRYFAERPWQVQDMVCATFLGIMTALDEEGFALVSTRPDGNEPVTEPTIV